MRTTINRKMLAPALFVLLAIASGASAELVGHWNFEGVTDGIVPDLAGDDDAGILLGGTSIVEVNAPDGGTWMAAQFSDVNDQIELVETGNLSPGVGPWSYSGWFQLDGNGGERGNCLYAERGGTGKWGPAAIVININPAGELDLFFRDIASQNVSGVSSGLGIQNDVWNHVAVVRDGNDITAYLNGQLAWEKSGTLGDMNMAGVDANMPLGNYPRLGDHPNQDGFWQFSGLMADVRVYNNALTADEVWALGGGPALPVGHWNFEDVNDGIVPDVAGGDDYGILLGNTSIVEVNAPGGGTMMAAQFSDVNDQIELVETGNLSPGVGPWSYSGWFQLDGIGEGNRCLYGERGGTGKWGPVAIVIAVNPAGELDLFFRDIASQAVNGVSSGLGIKNDVWNHLAVVRDGNDITAYLNGQSAFELSGTLYDVNMAGVDETTPEGNYPRLVKHPGLVWTFSGLMADVRIYKDALTAEEVRTLGGGLAPPVGHWTFEDVNDGIVPDLGGGDDYGILLGGTSIVDVNALFDAGTTKAAQFSAVGDQIELVQTGNLSPGTDPWSYCGWFKLDGNGGGSGNALYGDRGGEGLFGTAAVVLNITPTGELDVSFTDLDSSLVAGVTEGLGIQNDVWNHVAVVRNGGTVTAYLNGQSVWEQSGTLVDVDLAGVDENTPMGNYPRLGMGPNQLGQNQFSGLMDDVRVYKAALSADEVWRISQGAL